MVAVAVVEDCVGALMVKLVESITEAIWYLPWTTRPSDEPTVVGAMNCWNSPEITWYPLLDNVTVTEAEPLLAEKIGNLPLDEIVVDAATDDKNV